MCVCVCVCIILLMYVYWTAFHVAQTLRICLTQIESQIPSKKISYYDSVGGEGDLMLLYLKDEHTKPLKGGYSNLR